MNKDREQQNHQAQPQATATDGDIQPRFTGRERAVKQFIVPADAVENFSTHQLPSGWIKKIMKSDRNVQMISAETTMVFAKTLRDVHS
ncbi:hypothetical protein HID58_005388 [Brassica napus]|uniref:Uncharacterized protein n=1 Tax=Brassica napus TaxID=3708 RepID=A0ABQ8E960_BRANA|nr:hypothetical protein HID58_005388 [Brassica napus]